MGSQRGDHRDRDLPRRHRLDQLRQERERGWFDLQKRSSAGVDLGDELVAHERGRLGAGDQHGGPAEVGGRLLYPAFPYPNYTRLTRADSDAMCLTSCTTVRAMNANQPSGDAVLLGLSAAVVGV